MLTAAKVLLVALRAGWLVDCARLCVVRQVLFLLLLLLIFPSAILRAAQKVVFCTETQGNAASEVVPLPLLLHLLPVQRAAPAMRRGLQPHLAHPALSPCQVLSELLPPSVWVPTAAQTYLAQKCMQLLVHSRCVQTVPYNRQTVRGRMRRRAC